MQTPICDLILLSWNHPEATLPCVETILQNTTTPCRLIIVDQGSHEETKTALKKLQGNDRVSIDILWNPVNVGFPKGMNLGLAKASAEYVCFLNNDILVPPGWLEELIRVAESDSTIGAVNPSSNTFGITPPKGSDYLQFAKVLSSKQGSWIEVKYPEGFCLLAKRDLMVKIGGFNETTYQQIYFEDADMGRRLQALGYKAVMAQGTYVWHEGGQTMSTQPEKRALFEENQRRFQAKWGKGGRVFFAIANPASLNLERVFEQARQEANMPGQVWLYVGGNHFSTPLPRHLSIQIKRLAPWQFLGVTLWKALTKKKKFDRIATDHPTLQRLLTRLRFIHKADVKPLI